MHLTHEDVRQILRLLDESPYEELILQTDDFSLTLKGSSAKNRRPPAPRTRRSKTSGRAEHSTIRAMKRTRETKTKPSAAGKIVEVHPPLPGTFYRAPQPGAGPFVDVGSAVEEHTVVGLIETMKLMNSVLAGCSGHILEFCTDNGAMVDVGDVLMRVSAET